MNGTLKLVERKVGMKILPSKYVFKLKENEPKVRLLALGCLQLHDSDYNEKFAPVVTMTVVRIILSITAHHDLELEQTDVAPAFLHGDFEEYIYMTVPDGLKYASSLNICMASVNHLECDTSKCTDLFSK